MKLMIIKKPNPIARKCNCGRDYVLTLDNRFYACECGLQTIYVPNAAKGYYAISAPSHQPEPTAQPVPTAEE